MLRLLFLACLIAGSSSAYAGVRVREGIRRQLAVPGRIDAMVEGADGFLWVGTTAGLFRFDGLSFRHIADREGRFLGVNALAATADGSVWACTDESLLRWHDGLDVVAHRSGLDCNTLLGDGNSLWVAGAGGLVKLVDGKQILGLTGLTGIVALALDKEGVLWFGGQAGLGRLVDEKPQYVYTEKPVRALVSISPEAMVFGTVEEGLWTWRPGGVSPMAGSSPSQRVQQIVLAPSGELWIGSDSGIARGREGKFVGVLSEQRLPHVPPSALLIDHENSLWIAMATEGMAQLALNPLIRPLDLPSPTRPVFGLAVDVDGVWALDPASGLIHTDWQGSILAPVRANKRFFDARALVRAHDSTLWIGNLNKGVQRFRSGVLQDVPIDDPGVGGVHLFHEDSAKVMWAAAESGGVLRYDGDALRPVPLPLLAGLRVAGIIDNPASQHVRGRVEGLVLLTDKQIHLHDGQRWQKFSAPAWPNLRMMSIASDGAGGYWVAGDAAGLIHFDGQDFTRIDASRGLPLSLVESVALVGKDLLAMASRQGLVVVAMRSLFLLLSDPGKRASMIRWDAWDALPSSTLLTGWSGTLISDGARGLFATTVGGPVWIPDAAALTTLKHPRVMIESATLDGLPLTPHSPQAARGASRLVVAFAAPSFLHPHRLRFQHRLRGLHEDWINAGEARQAVYPNLAPGNYTFEVRTENEAHGAPSIANRRALSFELRPPLYRSRAAFLAGLVALLLMFFAVTRWRRQQRMRARALLEEERARIAGDLHDTLEQTLVAVGFQLQAVESQYEDQTTMNRHLGRARELLVKGMVQARASIWSLQSAGAGPPDLAGALGVSIGQLVRDSNVQMHIEITGTPWETSGHVKGEIERTVGEAVTNALKHAKPSSIKIVLRFEPYRLMVEIRDDGHGFDPASLPAPRADGGLGLGGMRARATRLGAKLAITSKVDAGTTVVLELPRNHSGMT